VKGGALLLLVWAAMNAVLLAVLWAFFSTEAQQLGMYGAAIVLVLLVAGFAFARQRAAPEGDPDTERAIPELSVATGWLGVGFALFATGFVFGPWLLFIAGGMMLVGLFGLVQELRSAPRRRRRARSVGGEPMGER